MTILACHYGFGKHGVDAAQLKGFVIVGLARHAGSTRTDFEEIATDNDRRRDNLHTDCASDQNLHPDSISASLFGDSISGGSVVHDGVQCRIQCDFRRSHGRAMSPSRLTMEFRGAQYLPRLLRNGTFGGRVEYHHRCHHAYHAYPYNLSAADASTQKASPVGRLQYRNLVRSSDPDYC